MQGAGSQQPLLGGPTSDPGPADEAALALGRQLGLSVTVADVLQRRGYDASERTRRYLSPRLADLTVPDQMAGRREAAARIARAIRSGETIAVFGDYDCDGVTSTAITTEVIRSLGGRVTPLLANRFEGGYGLSQAGLSKVLTLGASLLITCDCGSSDHERLAAAQAAGIDCVVIDHHLVPQEPLPVVAFLNPQQPACGFPFKGLASCGLALLLAAALRWDLGVKLDLRRWLDLVAIGTVADVAPLVGDNRLLCAGGLKTFGADGRPGLKALCANANGGRLLAPTAESIAYQIAPRLNAPGRLGDPLVALQLLLTRNDSQAWQLAAEVEQLTARRREIQQTMIDEALKEIDERGLDRDPGILLARQGWHPGVAGIVAGRVAEQLHKPTIIVALEGESGCGSARAPAGFRLYDSIAAGADQLLGFGGHQAAAGVVIATSALASFRASWLSACSEQQIPPPERGRAEVRLDDRDHIAQVLRDLDRIEPCGEANPAPSLWLDDVEILATDEIKGHLKLHLRHRQRELRAFGPQLGAHAAALEGRRVTLVGRLKRDTWRGGEAAELVVESFTIKAPS